MFKKVVGLLFIVMLTLAMSTVVFASEQIEGDYQVNESAIDYVFDRSMLEGEAYIGVSDITVYTEYCPEGTIIRRTATLRNITFVPTSDLIVVMDYMGVYAPPSASEVLAVMDSLELTSARALECATVRNNNSDYITIAAQGHGSTVAHLIITNYASFNVDVSGTVHLIGTGHGHLVGQSDFRFQITSRGSRVHNTHTTTGTWQTMLVSNFRANGELMFVPPL